MKIQEVILLLGGNIGDTRGYIRNALGLLEHRLGHLIHQSYFYKTESWGFESEDFINLAVILETSLNAGQCLAVTQDIEEELGRFRYNKNDGYTSRTIDIDILFFGNEIINTGNLVIPHPRLQERNFALEPLSEMIPDYIHPVFNKSILQLKEDCTDTSKVIQLNEQI